MPARSPSRSTQLARRAAATTRVVYSRAAPIVRRGAAAAARAASEEKHTLTALVAAGALGYAERENMLENVSMIEGVDAKVQVALLAWIIGRWSKNKVAQHVATGLGSVAIYDAVRSRG